MNGGDTSEDNLAIYDDGHSYCFACQYYLPGDRKGQISEGINATLEAGDPTYTFEYLAWRGISRDIMRLYDIRSKIDVTGRPIELALIYPNGATKVRKYESKDFYWKREPAHGPGLYGRDKFAAGSHDTITITEGELDAASLHMVTRSPVVSIQNAATAVRDCVADRSYLQAFSRIYIAFDGDQPGREASAAVARLFDYDKVRIVRFTRPDRKDANEYIRVGEGSELLTLWTNAKRYVPDTLVHTEEEFRKILEEEPKPGIPYPPAFRKLNELTYGMRTGESVLITAQEGVGKTEVMHAIEYQLLRETDDDIAAFFLEEPRKRHLQALVGIHIGRPIHLPDQGIPSTEAIDTFKKVLRRPERFYLYSNFGSVSPGFLLDTIRYLVSGMGVRWILLDHISMVCSGLSDIKDERREIDQFTTNLEGSVVELDYGLIMVSHVNDIGQTRSSRWPGKVANTRIDLHRDILHPSPLARATTKLILSKNRFASKTGDAGSVVFDLDKYAFSEVAANDNFTGSTVQGFEKAA
jgi:twinkle protein